MSTSQVERVHIGLEVHVRLKTASKLLCRCENRFGAEPNTQICPVCTGHPGALPTLNHEAVRLAALACLALGCDVARTLRFDRKSYSAPDLPKAFQTTQLAHPLGRGGALNMDRDGTAPDLVRLERAHLEEDAGKQVQSATSKELLLDFNRAGTPLLEVVTHPELRTAEAAVAFLKTLRRDLRNVGVTEGNMEQGGFRCDVNVSLSAPGTTELGTRVEIKNLNSFRFVGEALQAEVARQRQVLAKGGQLERETRRYDSELKTTERMRGKESASDYRGFPEPDLPSYELPEAWLDELREALPEACEARRARLVEQHGLGPADAEQLAADRALTEAFEATVSAGGAPREAAHWILGELPHLADQREVPLSALQITPERLAELLGLIEKDTLSRLAAQTVLAELELRPEIDVLQLAKELDVLQQNDPEELARLAEQALFDEPQLVARYRAGESNLLNALLGRAMAASEGRGNPKRLRQLLIRALDATP